jgi:hypothetical protein
MSSKLMELLDSKPEVLIAVYLPKSLNDGLKKEAQRTGLGKNDLIRICVAERFDPSFRPTQTDLRRVGKVRQNQGGVGNAG